MRPAIELELQKVVEERIPLEYSEMKKMLRYHLGWEGEGAGEEAQGKRIRPLLLLLCTASAGRDWHEALPAAAAVELLHNFSLIHDDIQDQSNLRRGRPTLWVKWGIAQAINSGDLMFTLAQMAMLDMVRYATPQTVLQMALELNSTCVKLTGGQYLDLSYEKQKEISIEGYWSMIAGKTAALLRGCTSLGALAAGVSPERVAAYAGFGYWLGQAFQVYDDYLGIWGEAELLGKSTDADLVSGKKSLPILYGIQQRGEFYRRWQKGPVNPADVPEMANLLVAEGAQSFTLKTAEELTEKSLQALDEAICSRNRAGLALHQLADLLLQRKK